MRKLEQSCLLIARSKPQRLAESQFDNALPADQEAKLVLTDTTAHLICRRSVRALLLTPTTSATTTTTTTAALSIREEVDLKASATLLPLKFRIVVDLNIGVLLSA